MDTDFILKNKGWLTTGEQVTLMKKTGVNILKWFTVVTSVNGVGVITTTYGALGGKPQVVRREVRAGKNIGQANETSPVQQALIEAESMYRHKIERQGYVIYAKGMELDLAVEHNTFINGLLKPMLAQKLYQKRKRKSGEVTVCVGKFPMAVQPKLNGVRCLAYYDRKQAQVKLMSREGTFYEGVPHIQEELKRVLKDTGFVLDGELYSHGTPLNEIVSAVRVNSLLSSQIEYHVYDLVDKDMPFTERRRVSFDTVASCGVSSIKPVDTKEVNSEDEADLYRSMYIKQGYEGLILRDKESKYEPGKRSRGLLKYKEILSAEFEIVEVVPMQKYPTQGMFVCKNDVNDETFTVNYKATHHQKEKLLQNRDKVIGKKLTVEFFERSKNDLPFHAQGIVIRDYE